MRARTAGRGSAAADRRPGAGSTAMAWPGRWLLCYNGEIFNYRQLRAELIGLGRELRTESDTELVLEAFAEWGERAVTRFRGEFAFAIAEPRDGPRLPWPRPSRRQAAVLVLPRWQAARRIRGQGTGAGRGAGIGGAAGSAWLGRARAQRRHWRATWTCPWLDRRRSRSRTRRPRLLRRRGRGQHPGPRRYRPDSRRDPLRRPRQLDRADAGRGDAPRLRGAHDRRAWQR